MGDARDALALQKRSLAHQRAGGEEQHALHAGLAQRGQHVAAQNRGAAARAGPARLHVLRVPVVYQQAAVLMVFQRQTFLLEQLQQQRAAHKAQIPGKNGVKVLWFFTRIGEVAQNRFTGGRGHGRAHIVDVGDVIIPHAAECDGAHIGRAAGRSQDGGAGARYRPLGCGRAFAAIVQRRAELAFRRAEMTAAHGSGILHVAACHHARGQAKAFGHGAARAVQAQVRGVEPAHRVSRRGALAL